MDTVEGVFRIISLKEIENTRYKVSSRKEGNLPVVLDEVNSQSKITKDNKLTTNTIKQSKEITITSNE